MTLRMNMVTVGMALMLVLELAISVAEEVIDLLTLFATQTTVQERVAIFMAADGHHGGPITPHTR